MNIKRIIAIVLIIGGVALILVSNYIKGEVASGRDQISSAQSKVDTADQVFSLNPYSKQVGKQITGSAQKKIDAGSAEAAHYEEMARWLQIGGIVLIVAGGALFLLRKWNRPQ